MKHEWRKTEKAIYLPKNKPELVDIAPQKFVTISGEGNPNSDPFKTYIGALYSVSYAIKMTLKKLDEKPENYKDYTVYPLEGIWDINDEAKKQFSGTIDKDDLVFDLMIRQPDFVDHAFFDEMLEFTKKKKPDPLLDHVTFQTITDGRCIQMMHLGSFDSEPESFQVMETFAHNQGLQRSSKIHREIYLSDFRKVPEERLKTVLRFKVHSAENS